MVRGRSYLAAIPVIGDVHGLQICYHWQVTSLLETMAEVLGGTPSRA